MGDSPAIKGIADYSKIRVMLYQGKGQDPASVPGTAFIQDLSGYQPLDADLTAIAAQTGTGIEARTGSGTFALRTLTGTANQITVSNGDGVSGDPTFSLPVGNLASGTFTPTGTAGTNVASISTSPCWYIRMGSIVMGGGTVTATFTAGGSATSGWGISLPIASNFALSTDAAGSGVDSTRVANGVAIFADATNDTLSFQTFAPGANSNSYHFTFIYTII